ncbi:MAG TPA: hypothetical protein VLA88_04280 [Candidatus Saccharimonadales bacterium]|nr:hypothetical protein [Candidatus Saccharimonadales bacterium]
MAEPEIDKKPETLDELTTQLDKDEPVKINVVTAPSEPEPVTFATPAVPKQDAPPPDPRAAGTQPTAAPAKVADPEISDSDLEQAADATEQTDDNEDPPREELPKQGLHLEANPFAPAKPFWKRKRFWGAAIFLLFLAGTFAWFIRPSRLAIVNALGLRTPLTITTGTVPEAGQQSALLKQVTVTVNGETAQTNDQGKLQATTHFGPATVVVKKAGYEEVSKSVMLDFDPFFYLLGGKKVDDDLRTIAFQLRAVGIALKFQAKDWLSDTALPSGTFSVGDIVAKPNDQGQVQLTVPATDAKKLKVKAAFGGAYIDKEFDVPLDGSQPVVTFVPAGKEYFISTRGGGRAVYSSNLDNSEVTELIPASDRETSAMNFTASPSGKYGVLASTRDGKKDGQNVLLQQVYVIDLATKKLTSVDSGQWVNFVDWGGDSLVYTVGERKEGANTVTQRLASVNVATGKQVNLATASSFGAIRLALDSAVYQVNYVTGEQDAASKNPELRVVPIKGGTEKNLGYQIQQIAQTDPDKIAYRKADGSWSEYNINNSQNKNASVPANPDRTFLAATSGDGQHRLIVGSQDGKVALIDRSVASGQDKILYANADITGPVRFAGNVVVFRQGSADYALSLRGGQPKKIVNVTQPSKAFSPPTGYFSFF